MKRWSDVATLTSVLDDEHGPARVVIDRLISNRDALRAIQRRFAENAGQLVVESRGANAGTVGTAFDIGLRFLIEERPDLGFALSGASKINEVTSYAVVELLEDVGATMNPPRSQASVASPVLHPGGTRTRDLPGLARASWVLALLTEVYRTGRLMPNALSRYCATTNLPTPQGLLNLASNSEINEVVALLELASDELLKPLRVKQPPWFVGPRFSASRVVGADADLIAGRTLIEIKTNLGAKGRDGSRATKLTIATLRQIIGYVLHDTDNSYELDEVALYSARFGYLAAWPLQEMLDDLAGRAVDVEAERDKWIAALRSTDT